MARNVKRVAAAEMKRVKSGGRSGEHGMENAVRVGSGHAGKYGVGNVLSRALKKNPLKRREGVAERPRNIGGV
jgi:hypothetical protein